jgi:hypothetical protein
MGPIALATADGRSSAGPCSPALRRGAVQEGVLPPLWFDLCGSTDGPSECSLLCSHPVGRSGRGVPFLTGQKGDEKAAGLYALRLTVLPRVRATNRLPDSRRALLRGKTVRDAAPRKAREKNRRKKRKAGGTALFSMSRRASIGRGSQPATGIGSITLRGWRSSPCRLSFPKGQRRLSSTE